MAAIIGVAGILVTASCGSTGSTASEGEPNYAASLQEQIPQIMKENAIPGAVALSQVTYPGQLVVHVWDFAGR